MAWRLPTPYRGRPLFTRDRARIAGATALAMTGLAVAGDPVPPQPGMGDPLAGLTEAEIAAFEAGAVRFNTTLLESEGLGPVFNKQSCGNCHGNPLGGPGAQTVLRFGAADKGGFDDLSIFGGSLLQSQSIDDACAEVVPPEATVTAQRVTNGSMGYGLIEAIPDAQILALESDPPGVSGRAHMVTAFENPGVPVVGKFGWKGQAPTMLSFSADAALNEMGLTNRFLVEENDPNGVRPPDLATCDAVPDPEDGPDDDGLHFIDHTTNFLRYLAAPPQTPRSGMTGESIFNAVGCASCHHAQFTTSDDVALEDAIRGKVIRPYSDLLLHDMGLAADFIAQGDAREQELQTPVLWGVRTRDPLWHDGRFAAGSFEDRVTAAIVEHGVFGSEAVPSYEAYAALTADERAALLRFLDSLGRREFDADGNDAIDLDDFLDFRDCHDGPGGITPDDPCAVHDIDADGDVDGSDYDSFLIAYSGPREDCNDNGILDLTEILLGDVADANGNGIPDTCECPEDIDGSSAVDVGDLLAVLAAWGPCGAPCPEDIDRSGAVDVGDLLAVLGAWGPCAP